MALVRMSELLHRAQTENYGVGAFGVADMEMILGAVAAAEELRSPLILQIAQVRLPYSPLALIGPMMMAAARTASVPVAVHLDHGMDADTARQALELGFTSVMIDGSHLPLEENIALTRQIRELAEEYGADVEAEVGQLGVTEDGERREGASHSDPAEVERFYRETGVQALAVAIGNAHGVYQQQPQLRLDVLEQIHGRAEVPLVLHGGTGLTPEDFQNCIRRGIRKINIATANFNAVLEAARDYTRTQEPGNYFQLSEQMALRVKAAVAEHIRIFGSDNRM